MHERTPEPESLFTIQSSSTEVGEIEYDENGNEVLTVERIASNRSQFMPLRVEMEGAFDPDDLILNGAGSVKWSGSQPSVRERTWGVISYHCRIEYERQTLPVHHSLFRGEWISLPVAEGCNERKIDMSVFTCQEALGIYDDLLRVMNSTRSARIVYVPVILLTGRITDLQSFKEWWSAANDDKKAAFRACLESDQVALCSSYDN